MITLVCNCQPTQASSLFYSIVRDNLPLLIAGIVMLIAYQQYLVNKNKLRLDLFQKRYDVYKVLKELIYQIFSNNGVLTTEMIKSLEKIDENKTKKRKIGLLSSLGDLGVFGLQSLDNSIYSIFV